MNKKWIWLTLGVIVLVGGIGIQQLMASRQQTSLSEAEIVASVQSFYTGDIIETERIDDTYVIVLTNDKGTYQIQVNENDGKIKRIKQLATTKGTETEMTQEEAEAKALTEAGSGNVAQAKSLSVEGQEAYEVTVKQENKELVYVISRANGDVIDRKQTQQQENDAAQPTSEEAPATDNEPAPEKEPVSEKEPTPEKEQAPNSGVTTAISKEEAEALALNAAGGGKIESVELDNDEEDGMEYEIEIENGDQEIEVIIQAQSGEVLSVTWDD
ncbi:PepSY domain-containing protein [Aureibacillus halotolerans]|uniref:Peptidase YpeB-like protein n=1 Tax=Aureibacillus halotolerans TaxID=1508390 RepID=A0A4R6TUL5_9BACI|nr:PepSY domain-containing protein [Aureibacillus halotolerans]TDQ37428.1 peptidase YpeB-like protein [Aureibacillus halotolerans]